MYIGPEKIIVVLVIALIVLGPERLPQVARQAGRAYREFRRVTSGLEAEVRDVFQEPIRAFAEPHPSERSGDGTQGDGSRPPALELPPSTPSTPPTSSAPSVPPVSPAPSPRPERGEARPAQPSPSPTPAGDPSLN